MRFVKNRTVDRWGLTNLRRRPLLGLGRCHGYVKTAVGRSAGQGSIEDIATSYSRRQDLSWKRSQRPHRRRTKRRSNEGRGYGMTHPRNCVMDASRHASPIPEKTGDRPGRPTHSRNEGTEGHSTLSMAVAGTELEVQETRVPTCFSIW
jgi:hypothetical protein